MYSPEGLSGQNVLGTNTQIAFKIGETQHNYILQEFYIIPADVLKTLVSKKDALNPLYND